MMWTLNKAIASTTGKILILTVFGLGNAETNKRYRATLNRLSRIVKEMRNAQMMHPSLLTSEYGSIHNYLRAHLSADNYRYFVSLQPTETPTYVLVTKTA